MYATQELIADFYQRYGTGGDKPRLFFAPGRVNLIGEHTDYNGGFVLPCALQYGTYLMVRTTNNGVFRFASANFEYHGDFKPDQMKTRVGSHWVNYPFGVFEEFRQLGHKPGGCEMLFSGNIPDGAGLSSSASIEMVTAFALKELMQIPDLTLWDLVKISQKAENNFVGVNCGIMDQFAVGMGRKDHALFLNCMTLEYKPIPLDLGEFRLVIANTNKKRGLADSKYNERVAECQLAVTYMSDLAPLSKLGEIGFMQFFKMQDRIPDELIRRRARHVISENQRVLNSVAALQKGNLVEFGALMNASHESLRDNYEVTGFELDTLVDEARLIHGVIGSRMTGAGFGGCTVNLVRGEKVDDFIEKVGTSYEKKTGLAPSFYMAEISDGVVEITDILSGD